MSEINLEYGDVLKAYQTRCNELLTQLTTAEARLIASVGLISKLNSKIEELNEEIKKLQKVSSKNSKKVSSNENADQVEVMDFNN